MDEYAHPPRKMLKCTESVTAPENTTLSLGVCRLFQYSCPTHLCVNQKGGCRLQAVSLYGWVRQLYSMALDSRPDWTPLWIGQSGHSNLTRPGYSNPVPVTPASRLPGYWLGSWIQESGPWIQDSESGIQDPGSWIQDPGSRIQDPGSRILGLVPYLAPF